MLEIKFRNAKFGEEIKIIRALALQFSYKDFSSFINFHISQKDYLKIKKVDIPKKKFKILIKKLKENKIEKEWLKNKKEISKKFDKLKIKVKPITVVLLHSTNVALYNPYKNIIWLPANGSIRMVLHEILHIWVWKKYKRLTKSKKGWLISEAIVSLISEKFGSKYKTDFCKELIPYKKILRKLWKESKKDISVFIENASRRI